MADDEQDPLSWDTDRLVQELCIGNQSWSSRPATREFLPKPAVLEKFIRDNDHNGESFLTYADDLGFPELCRSIGISHNRHQQSIVDIVTQLRKASKKYKHWKKEIERQQVDSDDTDNDSPSTAKTDQAHSLPTDIRPLPTDVHPSPATRAESLPQAPPSAKKRMAPTLLDANPVHRVFSRGFLTEADVLENHKQQKDQPEASTLESDLSHDFLSAHQDAPEKSYLGPSLKVNFITEAPSPDADVDDDETDTICWVRRQAFPAGRRLQVARSVKRLLLHRAAPDLDKDKILPDFGESDDEFDDETWKEIEADRRDRELAAAREAAKQAARKAMSPDEFLDKIVADLQRGWVSKKKPKHEYGARELWDRARLSGDREAQLERAKKEEARLSKRYMDWRKRGIEESWFEETDEAKRKELARGFLGATIEDLESARWTIRTLQSLVPPPRRATLTKPLARPRRVPKPVADDDDGDTISDDSDRGGYLSDGPVHDEPVHDEPDHDLPEAESDAMQVDSDTGSQPMQVDPDTGSQPMQLDSESGSQPMQLDSESESEPGAMAESPSLPTMPVKSEGPPPLATPARLRGQASRPICIDSSPVVIRDDERPDLDDVEKIQEMGVEHWQKLADGQRLTIAVFCGWPQERHAMFAEAISKYSPSELWDRHLAPVVSLPQDELSNLGRDTVEFALIRLFDAYIGKTADRCHESHWATMRLRTITLQRIGRHQHMFTDFHALLLGALKSSPAAHTPEPHRGTPSELLSSVRRAPTEVDVEKEEEPDVIQMVRETFGSESPKVQPQSNGKSNGKRNQMLAHDSRAAKLIRTTCSQGKTFKERGLKLQVQLQSEARQAQSQGDGSRFVDRSRLVVNLSKDPDDALIYINDHIGSKIKDHQIEGVRFMWNNVVKSSLGQGCLLAHEMGLGKTMQTITLLTVIAEASASKDEAVVRQIPPRLRESRTLVICPAGLVDNWVCEFAEWAPAQLLGPCFKVDAEMKAQERLDVLKQWSQQGGVLICSYEIFTAMSSVRKDKTGKEEPQYADSIKIMRSNANIAIADEAHYIKNIKAQRSVAVGNVETTSRIALTGSPLTKYVMNYYALINWVAPGYLGDTTRFTSRFHKPIEAGLWSDSSPAEKRKSRKQLAVLKALVEPIVNRNDAKVIQETLPPKREFIIGLKLTPTQLNAYSAYIKSIRSITKVEQFTDMTKVWSLVTYLSALVGHPVILKRKLEKKKREKAEGMGKIKTAKDKTTKKGVDDTVDEGADLSNDIISDLLAHLNDRTIEDIVHSNKMRILFRILDESKQVGDKVLIFSQSLMALDYLQNVFTRQKRNFSRMDGKTKAWSRQKAVQDFNEDPNAEIYLISTTAGCVGLNITGANRVIIFDFKYTPADEQQAIARSYRMGQMKTVYVYWLIVSGTFEQTLHSSAIFKKQLAQRVVDKQNPDPKSSKLKDYFKPPELPLEQDLSSFRGQDRILDVLIRHFAGDILSVTPTETYETEEVFEFDEEDHREMERDYQELKQQATAPGPYVTNQYNGGTAGLGAAHRTGPPMMGDLQRDPRSTQPVNGHSTWNSGLGGISTQPGPTSQVIPHAGPLSSARPGPHAPIVPNARPVPSTQPPPTRPGPSTRPGGLGTGFSLSPSPTSEDPFVSSSTAGPSVIEFSAFLRPANRPKVGSEPSKADKVAISPILAAGTHVLKPPQPPPKAVGAPDKDLYERLADFWRPLANQKPRPSLVQPVDIVQGIADGLQKFGVTGLPKMEKIQLISGHLASQRFSEALLFGVLKPDSVASALLGGGLESIAKTLEDMSAEDFKATIQGQEGHDPRRRSHDDRRATPRRQLPWPITRTPSNPLPRQPSIEMPPPDKRAAGGENGQAGAREPHPRVGDSLESPHVID